MWKLQGFLHKEKSMKEYYNSIDSGINNMGELMEKVSKVQLLK
jgi:hypothetical protein